MKKYVINLKRRPDRLQNFKNRFGDFANDIEVVYGFDGKNSKEETNQEQELMKKCFNINLGEIGCALSHFKIYKDIINNNYDYGMIFEDDAIPTDNFANKLKLVLDDAPNNYDILYIGGRFAPNFTMQPVCMDKISNNIMKHNDNYVPMDHDRTTHAYIVSKRAAQKLLNIFNNYNLNFPIDHFIIAVMKHEKINIYNSNPLLCHSPWTGDSDIR
jgi:glycosyl transferase family 25